MVKNVIFIYRSYTFIIVEEKINELINKIAAFESKLGSSK